MGYDYWDGIPRKKDDSTRIAAFVAALLAAQDELSELQDVNIPAPGEGNVLTYESPKWIAKAPAVGDGDLSIARYMRIGRSYYSFFVWTNTADGIPLSANYLYASAYPITIEMTFDRIGIFVWTSGTGVSRLGIYDDDGLYPGSLVLDAGTVDVSGSGWLEIIMDQTLTPGLYWLVVHPSGGHQIDSFAEDVGPSVLGFDPRNSVKHRWQVAQAYGALPATFPGGAALAERFVDVALRRSA